MSGASNAGSEMSARQRKHVYMHSTIFDSGGPTSKSVYAPQRQQELYGQFESKMAHMNKGAPEMNLPSAVDIRCTQNAGHGAVLPGGHYQLHHPDPADRGTTARTSGDDVLVYGGEARPVLQSGGKDHDTIPKEFWQTSVNLQWHDTRNERCRKKEHGQDRQDFNAQEMKMNELSSEVFGNSRTQHTSTQAPRRELMADDADFLRMDSSLHKNVHAPESPHKTGGYPSRPVDRKHQNLSTTAQQGCVPQSDAAFPQGPLESPPNEDPESTSRRRGEKNFSDLFGTRMGDRQEVRGNREEVLGTRTCSYLDTRAEIASRNKEHWKLDGREHPQHRKDAEYDSKLFDYECPEKPPMERHMEDVHASERGCWDSRGTMQSSVEISRRARMRDHLGDFEGSGNHFSRKQEDLASAQLRENIHGQKEGPDVGAPPRRMDRVLDQFRPDSPRGQADYRPVGVKSGGPGAPEREAMLKSAKDTKLASLQSSIFS